MKKNYTLPFMGMLLFISIVSVSCAQNPKVKTITIINGDTIITEGNFDEKEMANMEKEMSVTINDDGKDSSKKIVKKIIINDDQKEGDAMAYAYTIDKEDGADVNVTTSDDGTETKVIIRKGDGKEAKEKKTIVRKSVTMSSDEKGKNNINVNINIKNTTAKIEVETSSKEPLNVSILDENGKQVFYDTQKTGGKYSKEIPLGKKGTYFLNLIQNKTSTSEKIVVE